MATAAPPLDLERDSKIEGDLGSVGLNDLLQMMGMARRSGTIRVTYQGREGRIVCKDGEVLHAVAGSATGEQALARLVRWTDGKFTIEDGVDDGEATIAKSADAAVLEVLRKIDEGEETDVLFTPFPPLDKPDAAELAEVARKVRAAKLKPRRGSSSTGSVARSVAVVTVIAFAALAVAGFFYVQQVDASSPILPQVTAAAASTNASDTPETLVAAMGSGVTDAPSLLASYGVDWSHRVGVVATAATPAVAAPSAVTETRTPPSVTSTSGRLLILVEPWANVRLDGVDIGDTPIAEMSISAGDHDIVLSNPSMVGVLKDTFTVEPDEEKTLRFSLNQTGSLRVVVTPWADVYVDGTHVGQTPIESLQIPHGTHTIRFSHPELGERTELVEIREGEEATLKVEM